MLTSEEKKQKGNDRAKKWYSDNLGRGKETRKQYYKKNSKKITEKSKLWAKKHPEKSKENKKRHYKKNAEKIKERSKQWYEDHPEKVKKRSKKWAKENPEKRRNISVISRHKRKALIKENGGNFTIGEWELLKKQYGNICPMCGKKEPEIKLTVDHVIPINKGGINFIENIQPLCGNCNSIKGTKLILP